MRQSLDLLIERGNMGPGEHRDVLETFRRIAHDRGWLRRLHEAVATGLTAEAAVERVKTSRAPNYNGGPSLFCANGCMISTNSPTACCISSRSGFCERDTRICRIIR